MGLNYIPISSSANVKTALKQIDENFRQLAAENQTKVIQQKGGTALKFGKLTNGSYGFVLYDTNNQPRVEIGFDASGSPYISVNGTDGTQLINIGAISSGNPQISLKDTNGSTKIQIGGNSNGQQNIILKDNSNVNRILVGFHANGDPVIAVTKSGVDVVTAVG